MSQITEIALENYRSFLKARCRLSPFTLIVGANNAGKSNLLKAVRDAAAFNAAGSASMRSARHHAASEDAVATVHFQWSEGMGAEPDVIANIDRSIAERFGRKTDFAAYGSAPLGSELGLYRLDPTLIGLAERRTGQPSMTQNGQGVSALLDKWNAGARPLRARFEQVVAGLRRCVPEIEALSFYDEDEGKRAIQVEQVGLPQPVPIEELSDGTRLILALLTLVNQETPPPVILLEDIDRGLHPRLYEQLVAFLRELAAEGRTQILATTHDPYLIDEFRDNSEAVVIVEKQDGASVLSNLDERLARMLEPGEELEMPLGQVWFSGLVGGVPGLKLPEILKPARL